MIAAVQRAFPEDTLVRRSFFHTLIKKIELGLSKGVEHNTLRGACCSMVARGEAAVYRKYCPLSDCDPAERESRPGIAASGARWACTLDLRNSAVMPPVAIVLTRSSCTIHSDVERV